MRYMINRSRIIYSIFILITISLGLLSRNSDISLPVFLATYAGDTLWGLMVFWMFCVLFFTKKTWIVFLYAILFSYSIEFSQFYHAEWIDSIRSTRLGGLVLGYGFKWSDLLCYLTGITFGAVIDSVLIKMKKIRSIPDI